MKFRIRISTRVVFLIGKYAIKIPIDRRGWLQGKNESRRWEEFGGFGILNPVLWSWNGIIIQKRIKEIKKIPPGFIRAVRTWIPEMCFPNCDLQNPRNWGTDGLRILLLDYGIDEEIARMYPKKWKRK